MNTNEAKVLKNIIKELKEHLYVMDSNRFPGDAIIGFTDYNDGKRSFRMQALLMEKKDWKIPRKFWSMLSQYLYLKLYKPEELNKWLKTLPNLQPRKRR